MLEITPLILGPLRTNVYLIADSATGEAAVIDPAWSGQRILAEADQRNWQIRQIWITHAHFDHIFAVGELVHLLGVAPVIALHPADRSRWEKGGGAAHFGLTLPALPALTLDLSEGMELHLGRTTLEAFHTPGHTPGHCIYYCAAAKVCFSGDLIFKNAVGRTDLPDGDWEALARSIRLHVLTLPDQTRLLPGHGPETTVGEEKNSNPFIQAWARSGEYKPQFRDDQKNQNTPLL